MVPAGTNADARGRSCRTPSEDRPPSASDLEQRLAAEGHAVGNLVRVGYLVSGLEARVVVVDVVTLAVGEYGNDQVLDCASVRGR